MPFQDMTSDPAFLALPPEEQRKGLAETDPGFAALPHEEQMKGVADLTGQQPPTQRVNVSVQDPKTGAWQEMPDGEDSAAKRLNNPNFDIKTPEDLRREMKLSDYLPSRKTIADFARPTLEGGGLVLGALGGSALATPLVGGIAGAGLGYATGKKLADFVEGAPPPQSLTDAAIGTLNDVATGATLEMGGQLAGAALGAGLSRFAKIKDEGIPFTAKANQTKAAQAMGELLPESPLAAEADAGRRLASDSLLDRVGATTDFTPGQSTGNMRLAGFEQSAAAKDMALAERLKYNDAQIHGNAQSNMTRSLGRVRPTLPFTASNGQAVGASIDSSLEAAKQPVLAAERAAWDAVPNYPMPHDNFTAAADQMTLTPMVKSAEDTVNGVIAFANKMPKTVQGLQSIERTIGNEIQKANMARDGETAQALGILKGSIGTDFEVMGAAAQTGDIALHEGALVYPSKIQGEIDTLTARIAGEQTAAVKTLDVPAIQKALRDAGDPPNQWMKQVNETPAQLSARLSTRFQQQIGADLPTLGGAESANVAGWKEQIAKLEDMFPNLTPADDVAQAYSAAKGISRVEKFDRFGRGAVKDVLSKGDEMSGRRLPAEAIPAKMFTPTGSADLVRALSPMQGAGVTAAQSKAAGIQAAGEQMTPHIMERLSQARIIGQDGVMDIPRARAFVRQNKETLKTLGLSDQMTVMIKDQIPGSVKATMERMADKGVDLLGNPTMSARQSAKLWRDFAPAWREGGGDVKALTAMKDYHTVIEILNRNKGVSYSGGSTSIEKLFGDAEPATLAGRMMQNLTNTLAGKALSGAGAGFVMGGGPMGALVGGATGIAAQSMQQHSMFAIKALLTDAITNPETAQMLMGIARGVKIPAKEINRQLGTMGAYAAKTPLSGPAQPTGYTYQNGELTAQ